MVFINRFCAFFTLAVAIAGVSAQNFDSCGLACVNSTLAEGLCKSLNDTTCVCTNTQFQNSFAACLQNCSSQDLTAALEFENATCSNVSNSTASSTTSGSATKLSTSSSSATSTSSTQSSGATAIEQLPLLSAVVVIAGALMGGAFAL